MRIGFRPFILYSLLAFVILVSSVTAPAMTHADTSGNTQDITMNRKKSDDSWVFGTTSVDPSFTSAYLGNGYLGSRIPASGTGYENEPKRTETHVAGIWDKPPGGTADSVLLPNWNELAFSDGSATYSLKSGKVENYNQSLNIKEGVLSTKVTWRSDNGKSTDLNYEVFISRKRAHIGVVRLSFTPYWDGTATVTDGLGAGSGSNLIEVAKDSDPKEQTTRLEVKTANSGLHTALVSKLSYSGNVANADFAPNVSKDKYASLDVKFHVTSGQTYQFTKVVGVATSHDSFSPGDLALSESQIASAEGYSKLLNEHIRDWAKIWDTDIIVDGDPQMQQWVRASQFYLYSSVREGIDWSISPVGLSGDGYANHIFWDADTWMFPSLLLTHPDMAKGIVNYRSNTLQGAREYAKATGYQGARYAWESALSGEEETSRSSATGEYEQHVTADVALAGWQYFLATGDTAWLADQGWPVLKETAEFWASRVTPEGDGYVINDVQGPDEYYVPVDNNVYTNVAAKKNLEMAIRAAQLLGLQVPEQWGIIANGLKVPFDEDSGIHPEYQGYEGTVIKQADTVMLSFPWEYPMPKVIAQADLDYYVPKSDPDGPAMTDAIHSIVTSALNRPGCADYTYTLRSVEPFLLGPYAQFSESRHSGGVVTFVTGAGGFLQNFLYGYTGLRLREDKIHLDPSLPPQWEGITLKNLTWQGRKITIEIKPGKTKITLNEGNPITIETPSGEQLLTKKKYVAVPTRQPYQLAPGNDAVCKSISSSSHETGHYAVAAADGSTVTEWKGTDAADWLQVDLSKVRMVDRAVIHWGSARANEYELSVSENGSSWTTVAAVSDRSGNKDVLTFRKTPARFVKLTSQSVDGPKGPAVAEIEINPDVELKVDVPKLTKAGEPFNVTAAFTNFAHQPAKDIEMNLEVPKGWSAEPMAPSFVGKMKDPFTMTWRVTPKENAEGYRIPISAKATYMAGHDEKATVVETATTTTVASQAPDEDAFLSDLPWIYGKGGYGPVERDMENGETEAGDGGPIRLSGVTYKKGLGTNSPSEIVYYLGGNFTKFKSVIGIDDLMVERGSDQGDVVFQVWSDEKKIYDSGLLKGGMPARDIDLNIAGAQILRLVVTDGGDNKYYDHADWADARVTIEADVDVKVDVPKMTKAGEHFNITATFTNHDKQPVSDMKLNLLVPENWDTTPLSPDHSDIVNPNDSFTVTWRAKPAVNADVGIIPISAAAKYAFLTAEGNQKSSTVKDTSTTTLVSEPPKQNAYLSDMKWLYAKGGYGPVERDMDNGETEAGDGGPIRLNGVTYKKGLGTNSPSEIVYYLGGTFIKFKSAVGIDDSMVEKGGDQGDVVFQVWSDDKKIYDSGLLKGGMPTQFIDLDIAGTQMLKLVVTDGGDNIYYDHADWADARVLIQDNE